ncbi:phosphatidate cytidylyltransferase [Candidatus Saccharibacteria bacterium]|nr:phosphatidate cytidylyltransferase [Candidatus Saccharibacteria bacterium]
MDKNFRVRVICGLGMFIVALVALYTFDSIPFKIIYGLFALVSAIELISFFWRKISFWHVLLAIIEIVFLVCSSIWVAKVGRYHFWYIILGVCGYDIFAYLLGKAFGGKIFKKSRPFPHISKNKTWEGTFLGLLMSFLMCLTMMLIRGTFEFDWVYLLCGPLALVGDLYESFLKRRFKVKDSNEILIKNKVFEKIEMVIGGTEGHGGYLDRIDSTAFTTTILLLISIL